MKGNLYLFAKSVNSHFRVTFKCHFQEGVFGLPESFCLIEFCRARVNSPNADQSGPSVLVLAKPALNGDNLPQEKGGATLFLARPPVFLGQG